jgi:NADH-quinone oxidoreductase subunit G
MLIGTNPRVEAPVLNARIRKAWARGASVGLIGPAADLTYDYGHIGTDRAALSDLDRARIDAVRDVPSVVIVGQGALREADGEAVLAMRCNLAEGPTVEAAGPAHRRLPRGRDGCGRGDRGRLAAAVDGADVIYNLGADEVDIAPGAKVIYQGSHGDRGAHRADIILPAAAYPEEAGPLRQHRGPPATRVPRELPARRGAGELGDPARAVGRLDATQPWNTIGQLRGALVEAVPHLARSTRCRSTRWQALPCGALGKADFVPAITDHYLVNPIARASTLMAELSAAAKARAAAPMAAE